MCTPECETAEIKITARESYVAFFNGKQIGNDPGGFSTVETYTVDLRKGVNTFAANVWRGGNSPGYLIAEIDACGDIYVSDTSWKITEEKPWHWNERNFDASSWQNAIFVADWNTAGQYPYGSPDPWDNPNADWIWTPANPDQASYEIGWFRKDFVVD